MSRECKKRQTVRQACAFDCGCSCGEDAARFGVADGEVKRRATARERERREQAVHGRGVSVLLPQASDTQAQGARE